MSALVTAVAALEAERDALLRKVEQLEARESDIGRRLYRRGYETGYSAGRRLALKMSNPDAHARGWARRHMRGVA